MQKLFNLYTTCLITLVLSQTIISYDNTSITITQTQMLSLSTVNSSQDQCRKLIRKNTGIYHLSIQGILQSWGIGSTYSGSFPFTNDSTHSTTDFLIDEAESSITAIDTVSNETTYLSVGIDKSINYFATLPSSYPYSQIFYLNTLKCYLIALYNGTHDALVASGVVYQMQTSNGKAFPSPNSSFIAICQPNSQVFLISSSTFTLIHTFTPSVSVTGVTQRISFDSTSSLMIIETDSFNPVRVVSCINFTQVYTFTYGQVINGAIFFEGNSNFVLVSGNVSTHLFDTRTSLFHDVTASIQVNSIIQENFNNIVYTCLNNQILQYTFVSTPYIANSTIPAPPSVIITSQNTTIDEESSFYMNLSVTTKQQSLLSSLNNGIGFVMDIFTNATLFLSSSPFIVYFLGFFNYITLCSLYVLLNFPTPNHVYNVLKPMYLNLNDTLFKLLGVQIVPRLSQNQLINRSRPLFFGLSSDFLACNCPTIMIMLINFLVLIIFQVIFLKVRKSSMIRRFFEFNKYDLAYGQVINLMIPSFLPWTFMFSQPSTLNYKEKGNFILFISFFFVSLLFSIYYLFSLVALQKAQVLEQMKQNLNPDKPIKHCTVKLPKLTDKLEIISSKKLFFSNLLTINVLGQWFACLANLLYPILLLLENPIYFLIGILVFTLISCLIILKDICRHKNYFVLNLYPLLYHACFIIFYFITSSEILLYTEIVCLLCLFIGLIHYSITFAITILRFLGKIIKKIISNSKVAPQDGKKKTVSLRPRRCSGTKMLFWIKKSENNQTVKFLKKIGEDKKGNKITATQLQLKKTASLEKNDKKTIKIKKEKQPNISMTVKCT